MAALAALTHLDLARSTHATDEVLRVLAGLAALTSLDLTSCSKCAPRYLPTAMNKLRIVRLGFGIS